MLNKEEIVKKLTQELVMKSKTISHIILEGVDGVGKTSLVHPILSTCNRRYVVYDRGEISNFVYANKYGRPFISLQRNLPFIYVLLYAEKDDIRARISSKARREHWNEKDLYNELTKVDDQDKFIEAANMMKNDFHVIFVNTSGKTIAEVAEEVVNKVDEYASKLKTDDEETNWNKMYRKAANKFGMTFEVRNNQPYLNGNMFMSESTWQNGAYETFTDKTCPDNLLFACAYDEDHYCNSLDNKTIDFAYVINSKINRRMKVVDYYIDMIENNKTCLVSDKVYEAFDKDEHFIQMPRAFGNDFIDNLSKCKATVYCAPDLEYLKLQTCRLYEGIMSGQLVFVDKSSDKNCDMLRQIFEDDKEIIDLLYVEPETLSRNYDKIMSDELLRLRILEKQRQWFEDLKATVFNHD